MLGLYGTVLEERAVFGAAVHTTTFDRFPAGHDALGYHVLGGHVYQSLFSLAGCFRLADWIMFGLGVSIGYAGMDLDLARDSALEAGGGAERGVASDCGGQPCGLENPDATEIYRMSTSTGGLAGLFELENIALSLGVAVQPKSGWWVTVSMVSPPGAIPSQGYALALQGDAEVTSAQRDGGDLHRGRAEISYRMPYSVWFGVRGPLLPGYDLVTSARWQNMSRHDVYDIRLYGGDLIDAGAPEWYPRYRGMRDVWQGSVGLEGQDLGRTRFGGRLRVGVGRDHRAQRVAAADRRPGRRRGGRGRAAHLAARGAAAGLRPELVPRGALDQQRVRSAVSHRVRGLRLRLRLLPGGARGARDPDRGRRLSPPAPRDELLAALRLSVVTMIVIYGATGTTGALVARELVGRGFEVVLSGRDRHRLNRLAKDLSGLEVRPAQVHDSVEMAAAVRGARVVVACAGPFLQVGEPVLRAAIDAGAHYLDMSGEQAFLRDAYERFDSPARRAGVVAAPGFAWEVAVGDWAASRAAALCRAQADDAEAGDTIDELMIAYVLSHVSATAGTRQSLIGALSQPTSVWREDRWERVAPLSRTRRVAFPAPFGELEAFLWPSGEVITTPRHAPARVVEAYLTWAEGAGPLRAAARLAGLIGPLLSAAAASPHRGAGARARRRPGAARRGGAAAHRVLDHRRGDAALPARARRRRRHRSVRAERPHRRARRRAPARRPRRPAAHRRHRPVAAHRS